VLKQMLPLRALLGAVSWRSNGVLMPRRSPPACGWLGGLASMLDLDGDGNPLDDILRMIGRGMR
jgi:hypothetical protein